MDKFKPFLLIMLAVILTACSAASSPSDDEFIPMPTAYKPVVMLELGLSTPVRLIPENLDPTSQVSGIISQYQHVTKENSEIWYGGTLAGDHDFGLIVGTLSEDPSETVRLQFPIHLKITKTAEPVDEMNIISSASEVGGGKDSLVFSDLELQEGEWDLLPEDPAPLELRADKTPSVSYNFQAVCNSPGVYRFDFTILPYTFVEADGTEIQASSYFIISLACPRSFTSWTWNGESDAALEKSGSFIFQDGRYVPQP